MTREAASFNPFMATLSGVKMFHVYVKPALCGACAVCVYIWCIHLRRFKHKCISSREAGGTLPRQHHERVVPGDDNGTHTATDKTHSALYSVTHTTYWM